MVATILEPSKLRGMFVMGHGGNTVKRMPDAIKGIEGLDLLVVDEAHRLERARGEGVEPVGHTGVGRRHRPKEGPRRAGAAQKGRGHGAAAGLVQQKHPCPLRGGQLQNVWAV